MSCEETQRYVATLGERCRGITVALRTKYLGWPFGLANSEMLIASLSKAEAHVGEPAKTCASAVADPSPKISAPSPTKTSQDEGQAASARG